MSRWRKSWPPATPLGKEAQSAGPGCASLRFCKGLTNSIVDQFPDLPCPVCAQNHTQRKD